MNRRAFTFSLVVAVIAVLMVQSYMEGQRNNFIEEYGVSVPVVVAKEDIAQYDVVDDRKVVIKQVPKRLRHHSAYNRVEDIENQIAVAPILEGEAITRSRVRDPDVTTGLARQVSPGKRAVSIRVTPSQSVSKLVKPGDRVDVLGQIDFGGGRKDLKKVKTILQDVRVLSVGLSIRNSIPVVGQVDDNDIKKMNLNTYTNFNTVALELDPYQAQKVVFYVEALGGKPYLTLRNNNDKAKVPIKSSRLYDVLGDDSTDAKKFFESLER